jgi:hypothetical protein
VQKNLQVWQRQRNATAAQAQHLVFEPAVSRGFYEHQLELVTKAKQFAPIVVLPTFHKGCAAGNRLSCSSIRPTPTSITCPT